MVEIKTLDEFEKVVSENNMVVMKFGAEWCGPCRSMEPVLEKLSDEMTGVTFVTVNVDEAQELSEHFGIRNIPATFVIKDGQPVEMMVGMQGESELRKKIEDSI